MSRFFFFFFYKALLTQLMVDLKCCAIQLKSEKYKRTQNNTNMVKSYWY